MDGIGRRRSGGRGRGSSTTPSGARADPACPLSGLPCWRPGAGRARRAGWVGGRPSSDTRPSRGLLVVSVPISCSGASRWRSTARLSRPPKCDELSPARPTDEAQPHLHDGLAHESASAASSTPPARAGGPSPECPAIHVKCRAHSRLGDTFNECIRDRDRVRWGWSPAPAWRKWAIMSCAWMIHVPGRKIATLHRRAYAR